MTKYLDKYGTEIREGDTVQTKSGAECVVYASDLRPPAMDFSSDVVLSRADGSPVYRYAGGEDVRRGDVYEVKGIRSSGPVHDFWYNEPEDSHVRDCWAKCTLIRRAGEIAPTERITHDTHAVINGKLQQIGGQLLATPRPGVVTPEQRAKSSPPVLGVDRNGREVRRGDQVRHATAWTCVFQVYDFKNGCFVDRPGMRCILQNNAELVTDEKAETADEYDAKEAADAKRRASDAIESLCRALARPTMADRYTAFRRDVSAVFGDYPTLEVRTDCALVTPRSNIVMHNDTFHLWVNAPLVGERHFDISSYSSGGAGARRFLQSALESVLGEVSRVAGARVLGRGMR